MLSEHFFSGSRLNLGRGTENSQGTGFTFIPSSDGEPGAERGPLRMEVREVFGRGGGGPTNAGLRLMRKAVKETVL